MDKLIVTITSAPRRENEVPNTLPARVRDLITAAFSELFDEGIIDMEVNSSHNTRSKEQS